MFGASREFILFLSFFTFILWFLIWNCFQYFVFFLYSSKQWICKDRVLLSVHVKLFQMKKWEDINQNYFMCSNLFVYIMNE